MPMYDFQCASNHVHEELFLSVSNAPKQVKCNQCELKAKRQIGRSSAIFQPYRFSDTGYAGYEERRNFMDRLDKPDMGAAHRETLRTKRLPPNREFTEYKGKKIMSV